MSSPENGPQLLPQPDQEQSLSLQKLYERSSLFRLVNPEVLSPLEKTK
ncbi:MAG TPA: hypothetical protein VMR41_02225 [Patescibacteria group bacterium]|nr:hypothetical protein [Patescibacteria group bacterium]